MVKARFLQASALALIAAGALAPTATAHARLIRVQPADRAVLPQAPRAVRFVFDDQIRTAPGIAAVRNGGGSVLAGKPRVEGKELVVPLRSRLADGDYTVRWRVISDDGHEIGGVMAFAVGSGRSPPAPGLSAGSTGPGAGSIVARWLFFLGLLAAAGVAVFHFVIWRVEPVEGADQEGERRVGSILLAGCLSLALLGALFLLWLSHATFETRFGRVVTAAAIVAGVGLVASLAAVFLRFARPLALLGALLLLPVPTLAGHALDSGQSRLDLVVDVAHVTAAAVWLGGLLSLVVVVPLAASGEARRALAYRFSSLALASVALLVASGIWRAVAELSAFSQLWSTGYGRAILVKAALLAVTLGLAVRTRYVLLGGAFSRLRLGVAGESLVLLGVIVAVAFLTDLPPGRVTAEAAPPAPRPALPRPPKLPPRAAHVLAKQDGRLAVAFADWPAGRQIAVQATVVGPSNTGVNGLRVTFDRYPARACGSGCYKALIPFIPVVNVKIAGRILRFPVSMHFLSKHPRSAEAFVRRATAVFRSLRSAAYVERLSSGPGSLVVSKWKLAAPDLLSYTIPGGPAGIVIGSRRWDRPSPQGRWRKSSGSPLRALAPLWGSRTTNAHFVRVRRRVLVVSLLNRSLPAWFTISFDRRTLRPLSLKMTAAAHFMHQRYTSFNRPLRIVPPR
jgi:copper transport protein